MCTCPQKYSLHPYTGCSHKCLYCYATYYVRYTDSKPKRDFLGRLKRDLNKADRRIPIVLSSSSDPYPPEEKEYKLTRGALRLLQRYGFKVLIMTKSDMVLRDMDIVKKDGICVSITITTLDRKLSKIIEPNAPSPDKRLSTLKELTKMNVRTIVRVDPIIPLLNDDPIELRELVAVLAEYGVRHIVTSTYKFRLDSYKRLIEAFPEYSNTWKLLYVNRGVKVGSYRYLARSLREKLLRPIVHEASRLGLTYATCRERLITKEFFNSPTCDGTHLLRV
ncbi:MAG: radical SAM protein [Candidatus Alkanophagales archaeon]|nr:MAG: radical SAM protein [Candidatus Alkanophagales archaeon]